MKESKFETCGLCGVTIEDGAKVNFSFGPPGTRERLYARVCHFAKGKEGCINRETEYSEKFKRTDYYD